MKASALENLARELRPEAALAAAAALFAITLLAGALYGLKPVWLEYRDLATQHAGALAEVSDEGDAQTLAAIAAVERELEVLQDRLYGGAAVVPRRQIEAFVVDTLDRLSVAHGVQLRGVTPEEPGQVLMFEELPYAVQVSGRYFALHRWLHDVEEELRPMVVKQLGMTPGTQEEGVKLELRLVAYRSAPGGEAS